MNVTVVLADLTVADGTRVIPVHDVPVEITKLNGGIEIAFRSETGRKVSGTLKFGAAASRDIYAVIEDALAV